MFLPPRVLSMSGGVLAPRNHPALPGSSLESQARIQIGWAVQCTEPRAADPDQLSRTQGD